MNTPLQNDIPRVMLLVIVIGLLLIGAFWTMLPFLGALIWATTIVVATWPVLLRLQSLFGGRRGLAATAMTVLVLLLFVIPFAVAVNAVLEAVERGPHVVQAFVQRGVGPPPQWVSQVPLIGSQLTTKWQALDAAGPAQLVEMLRPYVRSAGAWALAATGGVGAMIVHGLLTVAIVAILYAQGDVAARGVLAFAHRLGGAQGEATMRLAGQAVRSVALGVIVTALVQSALAGLGLWICGVPYAGVLAAIAFVLGVAQLGPLPVMLPAILWLYASGSPAWGTVLIIWSVPVIALDNVLRPILIRRGVELPMLLIIAGVIGGLIAFGVLGLFVGPVILAAAYTLTKAWVAQGWPEQAPGAAATAQTTTTMTKGSAP